MPQLTDAQRAVLRWLQRQAYAPGDLINAREVFPRRDAQENGHRRALAGLCRAGLVDNAAGTGDIPGWASGVYRVHAGTYQALAE